MIKSYGGCRCRNGVDPVALLLLVPSSLILRIRRAQIEIENSSVLFREFNRPTPYSKSKSLTAVIDKAEKAKKFTVTINIFTMVYT